jgi:hypothetical protein
MCVATLSASVTHRREDGARTSHHRYQIRSAANLSTPVLAGLTIALFWVVPQATMVMWAVLPSAW